MSFGVTPAGSGVPAVDAGWPRFIQFQNNGVNLGGPDADTVNFIGDFVVTTGGSGAENVINVSIDIVPPSG